MAVRSTTRNRLGRSLVVAQVALSVLLLSGAALFVRTLQNLHGVTAGFERDGLLTMQVETTVPGRTVKPKTPDEYRADHARLGTIWRGLVDRVNHLPGVSSAAAVSGMSPLSGAIRGVRIAIDGPAAGPQKGRGVRLAHVTDRYFEATGIRLLAGRAFTNRDQAGSLRVAILNDSAARGFFGTESPVGRRLTFPGQRVPDPFEIVGVAGDARYQDLRTPDEPMVYVPIEQAIDPLTDAVLMVRAGTATPLLPAIRATVAETLPSGLVSNVATMEQQVGVTLVRERMLAFVGTFFAALALLLACIGLYGLMAYQVAQRTREIGIRIAVGARPAGVVWMIVRETLQLVAIGAVLGTLASLGVTRLVAAQLFGVTPRDPVALLSALLLLGAVTLVAGYMPARHASRIDPIRALRAE